MLKLINIRDKVSSADNQQGSRRIDDPSETTRRAPPKFCFTKLRRVMI